MKYIEDRAERLAREIQCTLGVMGPSERPDPQVVNLLRGALIVSDAADRVVEYAA